MMTDMTADHGPGTSCLQEALPVTDEKFTARAAEIRAHHAEIEANLAAVSANIAQAEDFLSQVKTSPRPWGWLRNARLRNAARELIARNRRLQARNTYLLLVNTRLLLENRLGLSKDQETGP